MEDLYLPVGLCNVLTSSTHLSAFPHLDALLQSGTTDLLLHLRITTELGFLGS